MTQEIVKILPCIADKFVIEIANSIQVSQDHVRVQSERTGKIARLMDGFTGKGARRQQAVNQNLTTGLNSAFEWLNTLTQELNIGFTAIKVANEKIIEIQDAVGDLTEFSIDTRHLLDQLSNNLYDRCDQLDNRLTKIELESKAERQITLLFTKWQTGDFLELPPIQRLYTVLERLYWGEFGEYQRDYKQEAKKSLYDLQDLIRLEAIKCLHEDTNTTRDAFLSPAQWAKQEYFSEELKEAIAYMGDWTQSDETPLNYFASQQPKQLSPYLPRILTAEKLASHSINEFFGVRT